ncbi:MAG: metal ABC transporter substrate-binding protein [Litoreibacter sp.]|nr:metal ABC transporter substrate-binding protein [Litoreibacter sp.]MCY4336706.1 metal ABC transporter substrate-binding protein [Litoreibacter sp.]
MFRRAFLIGVTSVAMLATWPTWAQDRPRVVAVNYALQYFAERLLGDAADVVFPVPDGVDPSFWRPTIADISMIQSADLILLNGAGFATWVDRVSLPRSKVVNTSASIEDKYIVTESITHSHGDGGEHSHDGLASYLWLDPLLAIAQAEAISSSIKRRGLAPAVEIDERFQALKADLEALDNRARESLSDKPVSVIVTHPRYQYFARRYGITVKSLEWEAGTAPTPEEGKELVALSEASGAKILVWEAAPPQAALDLAESFRLKSAVFPPLARRPESGDFLESYNAFLDDFVAAQSGN